MAEQKLNGAQVQSLGQPTTGGFMPLMPRAA
jgi:hypothetical protein